MKLTISLVTLIFAMAIISGCATRSASSFVRAPGAIEANIPVNEKELPGIIRYDLGFNDLHEKSHPLHGKRKSKRDHAYSKMSSICNGKYRIMDEYPRDNFWFIHFNCESQGSP